MTVIKASCALCGEVDLTPRDITLNCSTAVPDASHYAFTCPLCCDRVEKPADRHVIGLLTTGGVPKTLWNPPVHPERSTGGAPLNEDDLIVLGLLLHGTDELARWAA